MVSKVNFSKKNFIESFSTNPSRGRGVSIPSETRRQLKNVYKQDEHDKDSHFYFSKNKHLVPIAYILA